MTTRFGKVILEGYGSILKELEYNLDNPGLNIINAKNGAGKTTIFSGWSWILYGITLKPKSSIEPWEDVKQTYGKFRGTRGITDFTREGIVYHVARHVKYKGKTFGHKGNSELMLFQDGKKREDLRSKGDVQAEIISLLGMTHDLFKNSVLFGQRMKRLIEEDGPSKKKIFEEAFEADYLKKAAKIAENKRKDILLEVHKLNPTLEALKIKIKVLEEREESEKHQIFLFERSKKAKITLTKDDIKNVREKILKEKKRLSTISNDFSYTFDNIKKINEEILVEEILVEENQQLSDLHFKKELDLLQIEGNITELKKSIFDLTFEWGNIKTSCEYCGGTINKEKINKIKTHIQEKLKDIKATLKSKETEDIKLKKHLSDYLIQINKNPNCKQQLKEKLYQRGILEKTLNSLNQDDNLLKEYKSQLKRFKKDLKINRALICNVNIEETVNKIDKAKKEFIPIERELKHFNKQFELYNWVIKDPLSNSGIKAYIFNEMIKLINKALERYAKFLGFNILLGIDMQSANKNFFMEISSNGFSRPHADLSGGQKQLTDISLAFAVHDVVSIENGTNVLITDEAFEGLDADNIELVSELIAIKANNKSVHVITHLTDFSQTNATMHYLKFRKGMTSLVA